MCGVFYLDLYTGLIYNTYQKVVLSAVVKPTRRKKMEHAKEAVEVLKEVVGNKGGIISTYVVCTSNGGAHEWYQPRFGEAHISFKVIDGKIVGPELIIGELILENIVFGLGLDGICVSAIYTSSDKKFVFYLDIPISDKDDPARAALQAVTGKDCLERWVRQQ